MHFFPHYVPFVGPSQSSLTSDRECGECWERPLLCRGVAMAECDDNAPRSNTDNLVIYLTYDWQLFSTVTRPFDATTRYFSIQVMARCKDDATAVPRVLFACLVCGCAFSWNTTWMRMSELNLKESHTSAAQNRQQDGISRRPAPHLVMLK